ncbi:MAG TPA: N-6 DNA methylase [Solirubrobacterales bacterium]|nr:N-6 DNA methylase [Solirubrobacterales bacterium]
MDLDLRRAIKAALDSNPAARKVIRSIAMDEDGKGSIAYEPGGVGIHPSTPGFSGATAAIGDEELVRAYLLSALAGELEYPADPEVLQVEQVYKAVGRPGKGGRVDILVRRPPSNCKAGDAFLFVECKAPADYDHDLKYVDGQLFRLSLQEVPRPRYLVYYTVELKQEELRPRSLVIDTESHGDYEAWDEAGQPLLEGIPQRYGRAVKRRFGNVPAPSAEHQPLDRAVTPETFNRLQAELHDVIWGGGGTNNNEVFVYITKLILAKIYDERETREGYSYEFQRFAAETPEELTERMNALYRDAEEKYLALAEPSSGPAFDTSRISAEKLAFVVGRLEGISLTENVHPGDLLGEFFEQIVAADFTQTKGQFFTPMKIVRFVLELCGAVEEARRSMLTEVDAEGKPRLPYLIDPSCGAGSFLIEYMRQVSAALGSPEACDGLSSRLRDHHDRWFGGSGNRWSQTFLFGIENNYDLGLAAKVNMVLHGDGSANTWIASGLAPFESYARDGRDSVLSLATSRGWDGSVYAGPLNERFDLVVSNPPFSLRFSEDEKNAVAQTFTELPAAVSEALFIERWYQLLRPGGKFCCILPESLLDTRGNQRIRLFLLSHFRIQAVVSLPYEAFRPFTSTKTSIVLAEKRSAEETAAWRAALRAVEEEEPSASEHEQVAAALERLGWAAEEIFMAEPREVGYKRRKNLSDLSRPNDLMDESGAGTDSVLSHWRDASRPADAVFGFRTTLGAVASRPGLRLDPKYRWLWDFQQGLVFGAPEEARPLGEALQIVRLGKVKKGELQQESEVIDLDQVESRQALLSEEVPKLYEIGSDKVCFAGAELALSKLEPYLGKMIISPPDDALGSTEWVGLRRTVETPLLVIAYVLLLPELREAYRRLQAGKRHARLAPEELLDLRVAIPRGEAAAELEQALRAKRSEILSLRQAEQGVRSGIDAAIGRTAADLWQSKAKVR